MPNVLGKPRNYLRTSPDDNTSVVSDEAQELQIGMAQAEQQDSGDLEFLQHVCRWGAAETGGICSCPVV